MSFRDRSNHDPKANNSPLFPQTGLFRLSSEEFFIQPLEKSGLESSAPQAHAIYKRHASPPPWSPLLQPAAGNQTLNGTCGNKSTKRMHTRARSLAPRNCMTARNEVGPLEAAQVVLSQSGNYMLNAAAEKVENCLSSVNDLQR